MEKIKVLHIITRLDRGGSAEVTLLAAAGLAKDQYRVKLITGLTLNPQADIAKFARKTGVEVISIPSLRRRLNPINDLLALFRLYLYMRKKRPHIVHTHTSKAGFLGRISAKLARVPVIVHSPHGHVFYGYFGNLWSKFFVLLERIAALFTDKIITLTELGRQDHIRLGVAKPDKLIAVHCGIELKRFLNTNVDVDNKKRREFGISSDGLVVGSVGRLEPIKGYEYFLEAVKLVTDNWLPVTRKVKFLIVGDGPLRKKLENLSNQLGIADDFIFTGERSDTPEVMSIFDLFVLSSLNEGLGRVLIEAMACCKPVVATDVGGVPEIVEDGITGILVPPKDPSKMSEAILRLLNDRALSKKMGEAGRRKVDPSFGIEAMVRGFEQVYEGLLQ